MKNRYYVGPKTDHFDGVRFFNPGLPPSDKFVGDILRWKLSSNAKPWPEVVPALVAAPPTHPAPRSRLHPAADLRAQPPK